MYIRYTLSLCALLFSFPFLQAQNDETEFLRYSFLQQNMTIPPTPEAASLGQYGEFNVSKFTGRANIQVPIYALSGKSIQVPISLSYDHSGHKVASPATWVGMGWTLNATGVITRSVTGLPDTDENYFQQEFRLLQSASLIDDKDEQMFLDSCARGWIETQPDQYFLSLPNGLSAKFYIRADGQIVQRDFQGLRITANFQQVFNRRDINEFVVTDLNGTRYTFSIKEETRYELDDRVYMGQLAPAYTDYSYYSSWYLSEIQSTVHDEKMIFEYHTAALGEVYSVPINNEYNRSVTYGVGVTNDPCCGDPTLPQYSSSDPSTTEIKDRRHLSNIRYVLGTKTIEVVDFDDQENEITTDDVTDRQLNTIRIQRGLLGARNVLDFDFTYYAENDPNYVGRLTLWKVQENSSDGKTVKPPFEFSYNQTNIPTSYISLAQDHWGYYNGANANDQLIPRLAGCTSKHDTRGGDRSPNENFLKAGILEEIKYPTGGITCYDYEKHQTENSGTTNIASGLRIKSIAHYDVKGDLLLKRSYRYVRSNGNSSGTLHTNVDYCTASSRELCPVPGTGPDPCSGPANACSYEGVVASNRAFLGAVQGEIIGYSRVEEIVESNTSSATGGKTVCFYKNGNPNQGAAIEQIGYDLLTRKDIYDDTDRLISKMEYTYSIETMNTGNAYGNDAVEDRLDNQSFTTFQVLSPQNSNNKRWLCEFQNVSGTYEWEVQDASSDPQYSTCMAFNSQFFRTAQRVILRTWIYPKREITTNYFYTGGSGNPNGEIATTKYYVYDDINHTQPTRTITLNSDGYEYETETEFVAAQPDGTSGKRALERNNRWSTPFSEIRKINGQEIYRSRLEYPMFGRILPEKLYEKFPNENEFLSEVMAYDDLGNLNQGYQYYEQPTSADPINYQPVAMVWSHYGANLGARVQNATVPEIAYSSFENNSESTQGKWMIPDPNINIVFDSTIARHGKGYFRAVNGDQNIQLSLTTDDLDFISKYTVSYYARILNSVSIGGTDVNVINTRISQTDAKQWFYVEHEFFAPFSNTTLEIRVKQNGLVDDLRFYPSDALMTTFAYDRNTRQLIGTADENAVTTRYEYDALLRMKGARNFDNFYLQFMAYEYKDLSSNIKNAVRSWNVLKSNQTDTTVVKGLGNGDAIRNAQFFDNIGRPIQNIGIGQSPNQRDIISFQTYDEFGRQSEQYLPYTIATNGGDYRPNYLTEQQSFITNEYGASESTFGKMSYDLEESPLNRVFKEFGQGSAWSNKPKQTRYRANTSTEVRDFRTAGDDYPANSLFKLEQLDEDAKRTITYTDKLGRVIMVDNEDSKTYYIYDDRGLLVQVIQPTGASEGETNDNLIYTDAAIQERSFIYTYDEEYRLATKKIPGTGTYQYFYDDADQLVLTIDPKGFKLFTKYDILGRPIMTGKYKGSATPPTSGVIYESPSGTTIGAYTTNQAFPTDGQIDLYTYNYYDSHDFDRNGTNEATYQAPPMGTDFDTEDFPFNKGKATGSRVAILPDNDNSSPTTYLDSYVFYDKFGRVLQTQSDNHLQGEDVVWMRYNFPGWLLNMRRDHSATVEGNAQSVLIEERYDYDHIGRMLRTYHRLNGGDEELICEKSYNERDELQLKRLGIDTNTDAALQDVDYAYNIRRWLTAINDQNNLGSDLFAMDLKYETNISGNLNNDVNYNGNITAIEWRHQGEANSRIYSYEYDDLNRLERAVYGERNGTTYLNKGRYSTRYGYDKNGNILTLERNGFRNGGYGGIDNMLYTYFDDGKLQQIEETDNRDVGFKSVAANGVAQYAYDSNGNMTSDGHKDIGVNYNYLNLPIIVARNGKGSINWTYDATGKKLTKAVVNDNLQIDDNPIADGEYVANTITSTGIVEAGSDVTFTAGQTIELDSGFESENDFLAQIAPNRAIKREYCNGIEYLDGQLEAVYHSEGRVIFDGNDARYEYRLLDHLGNARVHFSDIDNDGTAEIIQENHYYPYGAKIEALSQTNSGTPNAYQFNGYNEKGEDTKLGMELITDFGLNVHTAKYRTYDPYAVTFWQTDPKAELFYNLSPYNAMMNNPIRYNDPEGDWPPALSGAILGGLVEAGSQVVVNMAKGDSFTEAVGNIDYADVGAATLEGALTGGGSVARRLLATAASEVVQNSVDLKYDGNKFETDIIGVGDTEKTLGGVAVESAVGLAATGTGKFVEAATSVATTSTSKEQLKTVTRELGKAAKGSSGEATRSAAKKSLEQGIKANENATEAVGTTITEIMDNAFKPKVNNDRP